MDVILPIILELKSQQAISKIHLIFLFEETLVTVQDDVFLKKQVEDVSDSIHVFTRNRFLTFFSFVWFFFSILISSRSLIFHSGLGKTYSFLIQLMRKLLRYEIFEYPKCMFSQKGKKTNELKIECLGVLLCFDEESVEYYKCMGYKAVLSIGFPRFYSSWNEKLQTFINNEKLDLEDDSISILLPSTVERVFSKRDFEKWLLSTIEVVLIKYPSNAIYLKPHPTQDMKSLHQILQSVSCDNLKISNTHVGILTLKSMFVISHFSTVIFDVLALRKPLIYFQEFDEKWMKAHPERSVFLNTGVIWVDDKEKLNDAIELISNQAHKPSCIRTAFGHKDCAERILNY
ncbi:MAG: hypothetical protein NE330_03815 [Lentisphaeraceae bacterium]|nr:hypothetical protein [Lentisphaeraceae bacterium]